MDPDREEAEVFSDPEDPGPLRTHEEEEEGEEGEDDEDEDEEEDARIFNAWMQRYRGGEVEAEGESEEGRAASRTGLELPVRMRTDRRASLPCPATLSAMQLSRLHSSTRAPVTARALLRCSSSRRLLPPPQEASVAPTERRPSLITTIPEVTTSERRGTFRRRNVMSLSDADSICLICHHDLNRGTGGTGGTTELQCTHTFHKECIEEWLWRKHSCPTCHVQVSVPQPVYWSSTRVKVP
uniref:putative RING-H2 finger protein ATL71 n=1 Tax=Scatophagus argus TaxID=75038 RepID=UPI001ED81C46|nr:putative RING-H2 finger protein ATL71 [Scatophagus argus]